MLDGLNLACLEGGHSMLLQIFPIALHTLEWHKAGWDTLGTFALKIVMYNLVPGGDSGCARST